MNNKKTDFWSTPLTRSAIRSQEVRLPEMLLGYFIGNQTPMALSVAMSIAGGAMLYVVFFELLPEAYQQWRSKWAILATIIGFALGLLLISSHLHIHVHPH